MRYYTLMVKWADTGKYSPEFGSYECGDVGAELHEYADRADVLDALIVAHYDDADPLELVEITARYRENCK